MKLDKGGLKLGKGGMHVGRRDHLDYMRKVQSKRMQPVGDPVFILILCVKNHTQVVVVPVLFCMSYLKDSTVCHMIYVKLQTLWEV